MKRFNIWLFLALALNLSLVSISFAQPQMVPWGSQYSLLLLMSTAVQLVFLILQLSYNHLIFRLGLVLSSIAVLPSLLLTLVGVAKYQDTAHNIAHQKNSVRRYYIVRQTLIGMLIINALAWMLVAWYFDSIVVEMVLFTFLSFGLMDAIYRWHLPSVVFHKGYLTIRYSFFKSIKVVQYDRIIDIKMVNNSVIALIENIQGKAKSTLIFYAGDLEQTKEQSKSTKTLMETLNQAVPHLSEEPI